MRRARSNFATGGMGTTTTATTTATTWTIWVAAVVVVAAYLTSKLDSLLPNHTTESRGLEPTRTLSEPPPTHTYGAHVRTPHDEETRSGRERARARESEYTRARVQQQRRGERDKESESARGRQSLWAVKDAEKRRGGAAAEAATENL